MNVEHRHLHSISYLRFLGRLLFLLLGQTVQNIFFWPHTSLAQGQATILVTVHNEAGQPISQVAAHLERNGADVRVTAANDKGEVVFHGIAAGEYKLKGSKEGFEHLTQSGA